MTNISLEVILIGIVTSFIATLVWYFLAQMYDINGRKKIDYQLEVLLDCARQFEHALQFNEYYIALSQVDIILEGIGKISEFIKPFTYRNKKRKLIMTFLYNSYYVLTVFKNTAVGYSGEQELEARCKKFNRDYMYDVTLGRNKEGFAHKDCFLALSFEIIKYLNMYYSVKKALLDNLIIWSYSIHEKRNLYLSFINIKTFKCEEKKYRWYSKYYMRNSVFTRLEYENYIIKKTKYRRNKGKVVDKALKNAENLE